MIYEVIEKRTGADVTKEDHAEIKEIMRNYNEEVNSQYLAENRKMTKSLEMRKEKRRNRRGKSKQNFEISQEVKDNAVKDPSEKEQAVHETREMTKEEVAAKLPDKSYL